MELRVHFPGNKRVAADFGGFTVMTDQPREAGGDGSAPAPFELFLASLGTCAGIFVLSFCRKRGIDTKGLELLERVEWHETEHRVTKVSLDIVLPEGFPEKYKEAVVAAAKLCTVERHLAQPPELEVSAVSRAAL